jgi:DNA-binding transcriptional MerR regulator
MFKIGDFSRLSRVPVKTLRYYDEIGLLKPTDVDRFTRYRYYSVEQLFRLNRILVLKELGFSLEQIGQLLTDDLTPEQLRGMLRLRRAEIEQQVQAAQLQMAQIDLRLRQIEQEGKMPDYEIVIKRARAVGSLSRRHHPQLR